MKCVEERAKCRCSCDVRVTLLGANSKTFLLLAKLFTVTSLVLPCQSLVQFLVTPKSASHPPLAPFPLPVRQLYTDAQWAVRTPLVGGWTCLPPRMDSALHSQVLLSPSLDSSSSWQLPELSLDFLISYLRPSTSQWSFSSSPCHPWNLGPSLYSRPTRFTPLCPDPAIPSVWAVVSVPFENKALFTYY